MKTITYRRITMTADPPEDSSDKHAFVNLDQQLLNDSAASNRVH